MIKNETLKLSWAAVMRRAIKCAIKCAIGCTAPALLLTGAAMAHAQAPAQCSTRHPSRPHPIKPIATRAAQAARTPCSTGDKGPARAAPQPSWQPSRATPCARKALRCSHSLGPVHCARKGSHVAQRWPSLHPQRPLRHLGHAVRAARCQSTP
jgi:hypothetical protein